MEKVIFTLVAMAVFVLAAFVLFTGAAWWLLRWSRRRPEYHPVRGVVLAALLAFASLWMFLFRWSFSYSRTVNGVGTNIHVSLGWLFLVPLALTLAAIVMWIVFLLRRPGAKVS